MIISNYQKKKKKLSNERRFSVVTWARVKQPYSRWKNISGGKKEGISHTASTQIPSSFRRIIDHLFLLLLLLDETYLAIKKSKHSHLTRRLRGRRNRARPSIAERRNRRFIPEEGSSARRRVVIIKLGVVLAA